MTADVVRMTSGLDEASLAARTSEGKWSLKELVCHLDRCQQVFAARVEGMLDEDNPEVAKYSPENDADFEAMTKRPATACVSEFLERREAFALRLEELGPAEWHRKGRHPEFPHFDIHFQIEFMAHHEAHHIYQMFQRRVPLGKMPH